MDAAGVADIMNVTLVPTGNARRAADGTITCQHGQAECEGNSWQQCAIAHYPAFADHYPLYYCTCPLQWLSPNRPSPKVGIYPCRIVKTERSSDV